MESLATFIALIIRGINGAPVINSQKNNGEQSNDTTDSKQILNHTQLVTESSNDELTVTHNRVKSWVLAYTNPEVCDLYLADNVLY